MERLDYFPVPWLALGAIPITDDSAGVGGGVFSIQIAFGSIVGGIPPLFAGSVALLGDLTEEFPLRFEDGLSFIGYSLVMELSFTEVD